MSYQPRTVYLDRSHELTREDVLKASPPPDWTAADEQAHTRAWSRKHVSNPSSEQKRQAWIDRTRREADILPAAEHWQEVFGC
jgi:hypothetical protein